MLDENQIQSNFNRFKKIIASEFSGDRLDKLNKMLTVLGDRMSIAPASSKEFYHSSFVGGYAHHVLQVYDIALNMYDNIYKQYSKLTTFTREELVFSVLFHDLGKLGDLNNEFYTFQTNKWRKDNLKENYAINPDIQNMDTPDRSLYLLQSFGIELTQNEWIAIKIHDGMYSEANAKYFSAYGENQVMKTMLPYVVHVADLLSSRFEYEEWKKSQNEIKPNNVIDTDSDFVSSRVNKKKTVVDVFANGTLNVDSLFENRG